MEGPHLIVFNFIASVNNFIHIGQITKKQGHSKLNKQYMCF